MLNLAVLGALMAVSYWLVHRHMFARRYGYTLLALLVMTAVFDSLIIAAGIVGYELEYILGVYIGKAPIEDFAYAVAAAIFVPALWEYYDKK